MSRTIKRRHFSKAECQRMYAKSAFWDRYRLKYNKATREEMLTTIAAGEYEIIEKQSQRCWKIKFKYRALEIIVIWDRHRHNIVTCFQKSGYKPKPRPFYDKDKGRYFKGKA